MNFGEFNVNKDIFSRMQNESKSKGYTTTYCEVENEERKRQSTTKTVLGILSLGALCYMSWKYVIKPVAHTLREILNIDEIQEEEKKEKESRIMRNKDRIFDGKLHELKKDAIDVEFTVVDAK